MMMMMMTILHLFVLPFETNVVAEYYCWPCNITHVPMLKSLYTELVELEEILLTK